MVEAAAKLAAGGRIFVSRIRRESGTWRWCAPPTERPGLAAEVEPFLYDIGRRLTQADLIVSRAGATTLAEITAAGKAAILIPLPTATDDHQRKNAEALASAGAAEVLMQADDDGAVRWPIGILALAADGDGRAADGPGGAGDGASRTRRGSSSIGRWR